MAATSCVNWDDGIEESTRIVKPLGVMIWIGRGEDAGLDGMIWTGTTALRELLLAGRSLRFHW
jgi:hypothetical protein